MNPKITDLRSMISQAQSLIREVQRNCPHDNVTVAHRANSGNYDPSADSYWVDVDCLDCGSSMSYDADKDPTNYRFYSLKK